MAVLQIGTSPGSLVDVTPDPASMTWGLQDVSAPDAGRVLDSGNRMYKMRTSQKRKLQLSWTLLTVQQCSAILRLINPEYFYVGYLDWMSGRREVREFYAGDRMAPVKWIDVNGTSRVATLSFDIIER